MVAAIMFSDIIVVSHLMTSLSGSLSGAERVGWLAVKVLSNDRNMGWLYKIMLIVGFGHIFAVNLLHAVQRAYLLLRHTTVVCGSHMGCGRFVEWVLGGCGGLFFV